MNYLLKQIKAGRYADVIQFNKDNHVITKQLRWNSVRHKFYLCDDKRGLMRKTIGKKEAVDLLLKTAYISQNYPKE